MQAVAVRGRDNSQQGTRTMAEVLEHFKLLSADAPLSDAFPFREGDQVAVATALDEPAQVVPADITSAAE